MGTKDGSRNFSANCDLERSMGTDKRAGLSSGAEVAIKVQPGRGEG